jgi:4-amino-4-deoxy-L-arabinose transferase-like glycosyltransferase
MNARLAAALRRIPRAGRACALIALVNAVIWSIVVPPFHVPDEISHFGYAQYLAEHGKPPPQAPGVAQYSPQEQQALERLHFFTVVGRADQRPIWTTTDDRGLRRVLATDVSSRGPGGASSATNQPPLYYAMVAVAYRLSPVTGILDRLALMRLVSALLAAATVLCVYLFVRELLPGTPWAWTVGALAVAFQPTFMFVAAGVQGDNLLFFASAAVLLVLARAFRRGLTVRRGVLLGVATAAGVLGKLTFLAFVPGIALALLLLALPQGRDRDRGVRLRAAAAFAAIVAVPVALYALLNMTIWSRGGATAGGVTGGTVATGVVGIRERLVTIWQELLPRLPFMHDAFPGYAPRSLWLHGFVGHFGWLDYAFPAWVYDLAGAIFLLVAALALVGLAAAVRAHGWAGLAWRRPFALVLAVLAAGLVGAIGWQGAAYRAQTGFVFEQARYLLPLLALYGLLVALAARGAGRRWGPAVGAVLVVLAMAHSLFAALLTISRYYG